MHNIAFSKYTTDAITKVELFTALKFGVDRKFIYTPSRRKDVVGARFVAFYVLHDIYHFTQAFICEVFKINRSSVSHGLSQIKAWEWEEEIRRQFCEQFPSLQSSVLELST